MYKEYESTDTTYRIHDNGLVETSHGNTIPDPRHKGKGIRSIFKKKKTTINNRGYEATGVYPTTKMIHKWVAEAFIPNPENKKYVNHIDGNKTNNNVDNLEWCTNSENVKHAIKLGLMTKEGRERSQANLTAECDKTRTPKHVIKYIRDNFKKRCSINGQKAMSIKFGISTTTISYIVNRRKHFKNY